MNRPVNAAGEVLAGLPKLLAGLDASVSERERERRLPYESIDLIRQSGVLSLRIPTDCGGAGGTIKDQLDAVVAIASVDSNVAQAIRPHFFFVEELRTNGTQPSCDRWWPELATGTLVGNALSESAAGRPGMIETRLVPNPNGGWTIDGVKSYSTGSLFSDLLLVSANDWDGAERLALIPSDRPGIEIADGMGQRTTATGTTTLRGVRVDADELVEMVSLKEKFTHIGGHRQLYLAAVLAGIAADACNDVREYVRNRARVSAHGVTAKPVDDPYVLHAVGDISSAASASRAVVLGAADALDEAAEAGTEAAALQAAVDVARAQVAVAALVLPATQRVFDVGGASAVTDSVNLHRHWRNARTVVAHNPLDYKRRVIGDWVINAVEPPRNSYF
ncbi:MAG: acyl-CoA dehydrogenase family protein [Mycobacterium sp.]